MSDEKTLRHDVALANRIIERVKGARLEFLLNQGQPVGNARFQARIEQMTSIRRKAKPRGRSRTGESA